MTSPPPPDEPHGTGSSGADAGPAEAASRHLPRWVPWVGVFLLVSVLVLVVSLAGSWRSVERVEFDPTGADSPAIRWPEPSVPPEEDVDTGDPGEPDELLPAPGTTELAVFLVVGSDSREGLEDLGDFGVVGGARADVIMLWIQPPDGADPAILSIPRDLLVDDPCRSGEVRINALLAGCGDTNGPSLLAIGVSELTGLPVDHFGLVDLAGFQAIVDRIGGYEICVEHPVRDTASGLRLPAGCTVADGAQTLAWVRSRKTQELVDGVWRSVPGVTDLTRNERQQQFLLDLLGRLSDVRSPASLLALAEEVADLLVVDDGLAVGDAISLAWSLRGRDPATITRISIPVAFRVTDDGQQVLVATEDVASLVSSALSGTTAEGDTRSG